MQADFVLAPYPGLSAPDGVQVTGTAAREGAVLQLTWRLQDPAGVVAVSSLSAEPERRHELWKATCFEFFLAAEGKPGYWEFNLAPAGHWNVYRFEGYRAGMVEEGAYDALPFSVVRGTGGTEVSVRVDTTGLGIGSQTWRMAVSAVVGEGGDRVTYWALSHPGDEPDFHHPDAFQLPLAV